MRLRTRRKAPDLSDERTPLHVAETKFSGTPLGPIFRAKRSALSLSASDIGWVQPRVGKWKHRPTWSQYEDGDHGDPPGGWAMWYDRLNVRFEEHVEFSRDLGLDAWSIELNPWSLREILRGRGFTVEEITEKLEPHRG